MILKIFKAVWFLSLLGFMAIFMYIYASLPETVLLDQGNQITSLSRDSVFYITLAIVSLVNVLVFIIMKLYDRSDEAFSSWFFGQVIVLNFFFVTSLGVINQMNSGENFTYSRLGPAVYGSLVLVIAWAISWPIYSVYRKISSKQAV